MSKNKKDILQDKLMAVGFKDPIVRWVPNNPMGRRNKPSGWLFREKKEEDWQKLCNNYESALDGVRKHAKA